MVHLKMAHDDLPAVIHLLEGKALGKTRRGRVALLALAYWYFIHRQTGFMAKALRQIDI
jgi:hypothetical protein